jgi:hypothetical protein
MQESRNLALKATEDQVKQIRDEAPTANQLRTMSVRSKISGKVHGRSTKDRAVSVGLSDQDIKAALSLVDESWGRQEYRLQQYLQRNYNLANEIPTAMDVDDEEFERPDTATNLGRLVEKVQLERTPTLEKEIELGSAIIDDGHGHIRAPSLDKELELSFYHDYNAWTRPRLPS